LVALVGAVACALQLQRKTFHRPFKRVRAGGMLLKLRTRPERRLQAGGSRTHAPLGGACPPLQRGPDRAHRGSPCLAGPSTRGVFKLRVSGKPDSAASAAPRRQQLGRRNCQARRPAVSRDMTGSAGSSGGSSLLDYSLLDPEKREAFPSCL